MGDFFKNYFIIRNTADVTGGKPIAVWSGASAVHCKAARYQIITK
jgi:hypothetical protein